MWMKTQTNRISITFNFVIHSQILLFSVFKIASLFPYWFQIKFFMSLLFYFFNFCDQFVAPKICHSRRHCSVCQQSTLYSATRTRFWFKKLYLEEYTAKRLTGEFPEKAGQSVV